MEANRMPTGATSDVRMMRNDRNFMAKLGRAPALPCAKPFLKREITFETVPAHHGLISMNFLTQHIAHLRFCGRLQAVTAAGLSMAPELAMSIDVLKEILCEELWP